ncbi:MAG: hypothetical protein HYZ42_09060, partial [Bacteroidetes bacterium]|nr:hypothetical protein [Bacteroidota bacterium]
MKKIFMHLFKWFNKDQHTSLETFESPEGFVSLSPIDTAADDDDKYNDALLWALQNRHINRNIAITGPYGSGKSSLIKTFEKGNTDPSLVFLNISLATFEEVNEPSSEKAENMLRLIELSILQQMFYHEEDKDIPDSRFKKTRSFPKRSVWTLTIFVFIFLLSLMLQLNPRLLSQTFKTWDYPIWFGNMMHYVSLLVVLVSAFFLILNSIRPLRGIQLKKFNFQDAEFGVAENISKSILNEHLDEILYFFEVTPYTVVIIEDLDRFNQTKIFTKLRELNQLINYSKKIKRDVAFVYAVRDDMFKDKDRTKFFDFIIPVIPVINAANSESKLTKLAEKLNLGISNELIDNISLFVDDMRLLHNILNEYLIYLKKVKPRAADKLFAMIVYKNIYPIDFVKLTSDKGELHSAIAKKHEFLKSNGEVLDLRMTQLKQEIDEIEYIQILNVQDLRKLYVWAFMASAHMLVGFLGPSGNELTFESMLEDEGFNHLRSNHTPLRYTRQNGHSRIHEKFTKNFNEIEKEVHPILKYEEYEKLVKKKHAGTTEKLKEALSEVQEKLKIARRMTIKELMENDSLELDIKDSKQKQIISILLRNGYIDENYHDYISVFHEGSLSKGDQEFLLNIRAHIETPFEHELIKVERLASRINNIEYETIYVLNYKLLDYLLATEMFDESKKSIFKTLSNEKRRAVEFVIGYVDAGTLPGKFINGLTKQWFNLWIYLQKSRFTKERIESFFKLIIEYTDLTYIKVLDRNDSLSDYISQYPNFLNLIEDHERLAQIIKKLEIKFRVLNFQDVKSELIDLVYSGNHYIIEASVIEILLQARKTYEMVYFEEKNYTYIHQNAGVTMVKYIEENIEEYVQNVLLKRESGGYEEEVYILKLLNNDTLDESTKCSIIQQTQNKLSDIGSVERWNIKVLLFQQNKVEPTWDNVMKYFDSETESEVEGESNLANSAIDTILMNFMEDSLNAETLAGVKIKIDESKFVKTVYQSFAKALLLLEPLDDRVYELLVP